MPKLLAIALVMVAIFLAACGSDSPSYSPADGDSDDESQPDGDFDREGNAPDPADGDTSDGDKSDVEPDGDIPDGDVPDGDVPDGDLDATDGDSSDNDLVDGDSSDNDLVDGDFVDGDLDADAELEAEAEAEAEEEIAPLCTPETDPFALWQQIATPRFSTEAYSHEDIISEDCETHGFLFAGAKGMLVEVSVEPLTIAEPLMARLVVADAAAVSLRREPVVFADQTDTFPLNGEIASFTLPRSGEYAVLVSGEGFARTGRYRLSARCTANCGRHFSRHPMVLIHGFAGWDTMIGFYNYFYDVEDDLVDRGYDVHTTQVAMFNDSDFRAAELEGQLMDILTETGARKLNLIAHSQGGIDSRRIISGLGHGGDIAVLAMVATPNQGTIIGDMIVGDVPGIAQDVLAAIIDLFGNLIGGSDNDVKAALGQLSVENMETNFNPAHPDDPGVVYWSWTGVSCPLLNGDCRDDHGGEWVNPTLSLTYSLIYDNAPAPEFRANDGLVPVESARWGEFKRVVNADHWDEIGQLTTGGFDHIGLYREIADALEGAGY